MDKKTLSNITINISTINLICMMVSFFTAIVEWSYFIMIGFCIVVAHIAVIFMLSNDLKMLEGTTNNFAVDSIDKALKRNKILLFANMIALIVFPCIWLNLILSA